MITGDETTLFVLNTKTLTSKYVICLIYFIFSCQYYTIFMIALPYLVRYLHSTGHTYGRPIAGQHEISAHSYANDRNLWKAMVSASVFINIIISLIIGGCIYGAS